MDEKLNSEINNTLNKVKVAMQEEQIINNPITTDDGRILIPMNKITVVFMTGGTEARGKPSVPAVGAGVGCVNVTPVGFLVSNNGSYDQIKIDNISKEDKWIDFISAAMNLLKKK